MSDPATIKDFWEERGMASPGGELATHRDLEQVKLEIETVLELVAQSDTLLDIGCGNGFSTAIYAQKCQKVVGLDFSGHMIETARRIHKRDNLSFACGDVLELDNSLGTFSAVLSTRCLINLENWEKQKEALRRIHRCIVGGGCLILAEGTVQGRAALNDLRVRSGLPAMPPVWHNRDFDETLLSAFMDELFIVEKDVRFGLYDVLTRVFYPTAIYPQEPQYGTPFHTSARQLSGLLPVDDMSVYSREFVKVFRKRT